MIINHNGYMRIMMSDENHIEEKRLLSERHHTQRVCDSETDSNRVPIAGYEAHKVALNILKEIK